MRRRGRAGLRPDVRRLRRAAKLLTTAANIPIKEVSVLCGFDDPNYFSKVFRRLYGTNPSEFRTSGMYPSAPHN